MSVQIILPFQRLKHTYPSYFILWFVKHLLKDIKDEVDVDSNWIDMLFGFEMSTKVMIMSYEIMIKVFGYKN